MIEPLPQPPSPFLDATPLLELKNQTVVARSFTEAEYRSLANAAFETVSLLALLRELSLSLKDPPSLLCNNLGASHLNFNTVQHSKTKHVQINLHFVCDLV